MSSCCKVTQNSECINTIPTEIFGAEHVSIRVQVCFFSILIIYKTIDQYRPRSTSIAVSFRKWTQATCIWACCICWAPTIIGPIAVVIVISLITVYLPNRAINSPYHESNYCLNSFLRIISSQVLLSSIFYTQQI
jgi:hypothetical protein